MRDRLLRITSYTLLVLVGLAALVVAAWLIDDRLIHGDTVSRNVTVGGQHVGGLGAADLDAVLGALASETARQQLTVTAPERILTATNEEAGVELDTEKVAGAAMAAGRNDGMVNDFTSWLGGFLSPRPVADAYLLHQDRLEQWVTDHPDRTRGRRVEPSFTGADGELVVSPGEPGYRIEPDTVIDAVETELAAGRVPVTAEVEWGLVEPRVRPETLAAAVEEAEQIATRPLTLTVEDEVVQVGQSTVTAWIASERDGNQLHVALDEEQIQEEVERLLADVETEGEAPTFAIVDGEVEVAYGVPPMRCCDTGAAELVVDALRSGSVDPVELPLVATVDPDEQVEALGINEIVGEFTTNHACCENRVQNIHRIADLIRGVVIPPGEQFSINEHVGRRTTENGFVAAGTIQQGRFVDGVGGGISQFATTMFNAAFFAGLDFIAYQSHSIYISRYPYGREATLSYPVPDLIVENNTPYGMLIWPEYTGTSITVQLWSTPYFDVEETGQSSFKISECTRVETFRERTSPDGGVLEDMVFATYRPGEGLDCNGDPTPGGND